MNAGPGRASWTFLILAVVLAAVFGRLGVWQLGRLGERRAANQLIEARLERVPAALAAAARSGVPAESLTWRRFRAAGTWDTEHEILIRGRASQGTPGVHVVTPLVFLPDSAVLVLRGWLPAADGLSADLTSARPAKEGLAVRIEGLALASEAPSRVRPRRRLFDGAERVVLSTLSVEQAAESIPYDLLPVFLLAAPTGETSGPPAPVREPALSDGPHLWYAIQWFGFALISLAGALVYIRTRRRQGSSEGEIA